MQRHMTGITDIDREILMRFDDKELFEVCFSKSKYSLKLCDEMFFRNRSFQKFPTITSSKPENMTWKKFYIIVSSLKNNYNSSLENIKLYFENKDKITFVKRDSQLAKFLDSLAITGEVGNLLYRYTVSTSQYSIVTMEMIFKIIVMCKMLNIKEVPDNFLNDLLKDDELDLNHPLIISDLEKRKKLINTIYKEKLGDKLIFEKND